MARTGNERSLGTAEGALLGRAMHALHAESPVLADAWAIQLLPAGVRAHLRSPDFVAGGAAWDDFDARPLFALNVGALRFAEDEVERSVGAGLDQYVVLGAGFDTFALRRADLAGRLRVFEVDHPDVQALTRDRIAEAEATPAALPCFVPIDFETSSLREGLGASPFDPMRPAVFSWMNTLPYLSAEATTATLREIAALSAPGSRLVLNYTPDVPLAPAQQDYQARLQQRLEQAGEPMHSTWKPAHFEALLEREGFAVVEHLGEHDLHVRYFEGRGDGLTPSQPARLVVAERRG